MATEPLHDDDPRRIGPFTIEGRLGGGGMGMVYLGRGADGIAAAVKTIRPDRSGDDRSRARFRREIAAARAVGGFWGAAVLDAGPDEPVPWMATTYLTGPTLADAVRDGGPLPVATARTLLAMLAETLGAIHELGLVHRDLKPANIILADDGPHLVDFGIVRPHDATALTGHGAVGTAPYMSPEQARGLEVGSASDVFSLGSVLVFATTGRPPFGTGEAQRVAQAVVDDDPDLDGVPPELSGLARDCLAKDPDRRPATSRLAAVVAPAERTWVAPTLARPAARRPTGLGDWLTSRRPWQLMAIGAAVAGVVTLPVAAAAPWASSDAEPASDGASPGPDPFGMSHQEHTITLKAWATGPDAQTAPTVVTYHANLGGADLLSSSDLTDLDPTTITAEDARNLYTSVDLPWSLDRTLRGDADEHRISFTVQAQDPSDPLAEFDLTLHCEALIDGAVVAAESSTDVDVVNCVTLPAADDAP